MLKKDFLHDLRNSLMVIKGNLDLIKTSNIKSSADQKYLETALKELNSLKKILDEQKD